MKKYFTQKPRQTGVKNGLILSKGRREVLQQLFCHAYELGDLENRRRLEFAYPYLFSAARKCYYADNPEAAIQQILSEEE